MDENESEQHPPARGAHTSRDSAGELGATVVVFVHSSLGGATVVAEVILIALFVVAWVVSVALFLRKWRRLRLHRPRAIYPDQQPKNLEAVTVIDRPAEAVIYCGYPAHIASTLQARLTRVRRHASLRLTNLPLFMASSADGSQNGAALPAEVLSTLPEETSSCSDAGSSDYQPEVTSLPEVTRSVPEVALWLPEETLSLPEVNPSRPEVTLSMQEASLPVNGVHHNVPS